MGWVRPQLASHTRRIDANALQIEKTNMTVARSPVGRHFRLEFSEHPLERKGSRFITEIRAGLATFFAMAYIISVNASIVAGTYSSPPRS